METLSRTAGWASLKQETVENILAKEHRFRRSRQLLLDEFLFGADVAFLRHNFGDTLQTESLWFSLVHQLGYMDEAFDISLTLDQAVVTHGQRVRAFAIEWLHQKSLENKVRGECISQVVDVCGAEEKGGHPPQEMVEESDEGTEAEAADCVDEEGRWTDNFPDGKIFDNAEEFIHLIGEILDASSAVSPTSSTTSSCGAGPPSGDQTIQGQVSTVSAGSKRGRSYTCSGDELEDEGDHQGIFKRSRASRHENMPADSELEGLLEDDDLERMLSAHYIIENEVPIFQQWQQHQQQNLHQRHGENKLQISTASALPGILRVPDEISSDDDVWDACQWLPTLPDLDAEWSPGVDPQGLPLNLLEFYQGIDDALSSAAAVQDLQWISPLPDGW
jgi:hypothetical protein